MVRLADITPSIAIEASGVPELVMRRVLLDAARLFCRRSRYWRVNLDPISMVDAQSRYDLFSPINDSSVYDIVSVRMGTERKFLTRSTYSKLQFNLDNSGTPTQFALEAAKEIIFAPIPVATTADANIRVTLVPDTSATTLDDRLFDDFGEGLIYGALYRLMRMPGKAWSDSTLAGHYGSLYSMKEQEARGLADDEFTVGVERVVRYGGY